MSDNQDLINKDGDENVVLQFTRKQFSDFVFTHVQTPSEERRAYTLGFDVTRADLRRIVDKITYQVGTLNTLLNHEFSATIESAPHQLRKINSYDDFFHIDHFDSAFSWRVSITLSYLVEFNRGEALPTPEKQVVTFRFVAGDEAEGDIEIRSTEFTWPDRIFETVRKEFSEIEDRVRAKNKESNFFIFRFLSKYHHIFSISAVLNGFVIICTSSVVILSALYNGYLRNNIDTDLSAKVYDSDRQSYIVLNMKDILTSSDWRETVRDIELSQTLKNLHDATILAQDNTNGEKSGILEWITHAIVSVPPYYWVGFGLIVLLSFLNVREQKRMALNDIGRIWLSNADMPPRRTIPPSEVIGEAVMVSVFTSALFTFGVMAIQAILS